MSNILTPAQVAEILARADAATRDWELRCIDTGVPVTYPGDEDLEAWTHEPQYFKYIDGDQVFCPAYTVDGLEALGNHECAAMEKPNAEFVFHSRTDIPALAESHEAQRTRLEATEADLKHAEMQAQNWQTDAEIARAELAALKATVAKHESEEVRIHELLALVPHHRKCASQSYSRVTGPKKSLGARTYGICDCWKSRIK